MKKFSEICKETEEKLDRELKEKEIEFLQWMYKRYLEERSADLSKRDCM